MIVCSLNTISFYLSLSYVVIVSYLCFSIVAPRQRPAEEHRREQEEGHPQPGAFGCSALPPLSGATSHLPCLMPLTTSQLIGRV